MNHPAHPHLGDLPDEELAPMLRTGTAGAAMADLYARHNTAVLAYVRNCCRDTHTTCNGTGSQNWDVLPLGPGLQVSVRNASTGVCLTHTGTTTDGTPVRQRRHTAPGCTPTGSGRAPDHGRAMPRRYLEPRACSAFRALNCATHAATSRQPARGKARSDTSRSALGMFTPGCARGRAPRRPGRAGPAGCRRGR